MLKKLLAAVGFTLVLPLAHAGDIVWTLVTGNEHVALYVSEASITAISPTVRRVLEKDVLAEPIDGNVKETVAVVDYNCVSRKYTLLGLILNDADGQVIGTYVYGHDNPSTSAIAQPGTLAGVVFKYICNLPMPKK